MVSDFVHQHVGDDVTKRLVVLGPVIEDCPSEESYPVRTFSGLRIPSFGYATPLENAEQVEGRFKRK